MKAWLYRFVNETSEGTFWLAMSAAIILCLVFVAFLLRGERVPTADALCRAQCARALDYERVGLACYCCTQPPSHMHTECEEVVW